MGAFKLLDFSTERYILPEEVIFLQGNRTIKTQKNDKL